ncbi:terminase [Corynebacterium aquilae DSM 44791]|uniref:Terminase n=1 Tax=Corynebacterium aquilae DSM 44791 TaxID=1431546 RepID=A0A1L7CHP1_9CORY|nr:terminase [Corynebacterium aquilae DSM 44791]
MYPWQEWLLKHGLELTPEGEFRFKTVLVLVARQNGKTTVMKVLGLWRLFVYGAGEIVSTAQTLGVAVATLEEAFKLAAFNPVLRQFLKDNPRDDSGAFNGAWISRVNGANHFALKMAPVPEALDKLKSNLPTWRVAVNDRGGGRSLSADMVFLDELREHLTYEGWKAAVPTSIARPRSQVWGFSNAGDKRSVVLRDQRTKAIARIEAGNTADTQTALFEWSALPERDIHDVDGYAEANPSMGYGAISESTLRATAADTSDPDGFRTEHLCQWVEHTEQGKIHPGLWEKNIDEASAIAEDSPLAVGIDVAPDGTFTSIAVAGEREDGRTHVEVVAVRAGFRWVADWLNARRGSWFNGEVALQVKGAPSATLAPLLEDAGITVIPWQGSDMSKAVIGFYDSLREGTIHYLKQPALTESALGIRERRYGDLFFWDRGKSMADPSPLIAVNIAWWLLRYPPEDGFVSAYSAEDFDTPLEEVDSEDSGVLIV